MDISMRQRLPKFVETGSCFDTTDIDRVKVRIPKKRERTPHLCFHGVEIILTIAFIVMVIFNWNKRVVLEDMKHYQKDL